MPGRGPFSRWRARTSTYIWSADEEQALPGSPNPDDFTRPMPRLPRPAALEPHEPAALTVALATAVLLAATFLDWGLPHINLASSREAVFLQGQWHLVFTAMLSHADLAHLLSNLLGFVTFGYLLKRSFGCIAFPVIPALAGVVITILTNATTPASQGLIGSSGVVFAMVGLYVTLYFFSEHRFSWQKRLARITGFLLILFFPHEYSHDISYLAHAYGLGLGILAGLILAPHVPKRAPHRQELASADETLHLLP